MAPIQYCGALISSQHIQHCCHGRCIEIINWGHVHLYAICFGVASLILQVFIPYRRYVRILKWLTLTLLAYVATVFVVDISWMQVLKGTLLPHLSWKPEYITTVVAVFGTTISPYLFFWQASQEVEEQRLNPEAKPIREAPEQAVSNFRRIKIDNYIGMGFSNIVAFFIILTTAVALNLHGITDIQTSAQAATALRPIGGEFAFWLFSAGIIGTGLLAVPVLAGSAAYAIAGAFNWEKSLELDFMGAKKFYSIIVISTLMGVALCFAPISPFKALYWSAVVNGIISVPIMGLMMLMAAHPKIMGKFIITLRLKILGWLATAVMAVAVITLFMTLGK
jgi:Mn2+/Fe2+ NRAMP family transporter